MPKFSEYSRVRLAKVDPRLRQLFCEVIKHFDCRVLCGHRDQAEQDALYPARSQVRWPHSRHNSQPSQAIDVVPYPVDFEDRERITLFAGFVKGVASQMGIAVRWGGDWDNDTEIDDNKFDDLPHFEII